MSARGESVSLNLLRHLVELEKGITTEQERQSFQTGLSLLRQRMVAAAVPSWRQAAEQHRSSVPIHCGLAVALHMAGEVEESGAILIRLAEIHPDQMLLVPILGEIASSSPAQKPAMEARLRNFLRTAPKHGGARHYLAELLAAGLPEPPAESIRLWQEAATFDTGDARPCLAMARVEQARNNSASAIAWLTRALERDPASAEAHYQLARLYFRTGQRDVGNQHLQRFHALRK